MDPNGSRFPCTVGCVGEGLPPIERVGGEREEREVGFEEWKGV